MGGGETYPSAETVQRLVDGAIQAEAAGNKKLSADTYREASQVLLRIGQSNAITEDERYCFQMQSSEFITKAMELEKDLVQNQNVQETTATTTTGTQNKSNTNDGGVNPAENYVPLNDAQVEGQVEQNEEKRTSPETGAAFVGATTGFLSGCILGIPIIGGIAGGVFGSVAANRQDEYGERARKMGTYGSNFIDNSSKLNKKYNISGNVKVGAESLLYKARQFDERHDVVGKVASAASCVWNKARTVEEQHDLSGKAKQAVEATVTGASNLNDRYKISEKVTTKLNSALNGPSQNNNIN